MTGFDAELYLRLVGEQMLLNREERSGGPWRPAIVEAAAALVAVARVESERAERVLEDYGLAWALREDPQFLRRAVVRGSRLAPSEPRPLRPRRVVPCGRTV